MEQKTRRILIAFAMAVFVILLSFILYHFFTVGSSTPNSHSPIPNNNNNFMDITMDLDSNDTSTKYIIFDETKVPCNTPAGCVWGNTPMRFAITTTGDPVDYSKYRTMTSNVVPLASGQTLTLAIMKTADDKPMWQNGADDSGTGFYVSSTQTPPQNGAASRFEFDWNANNHTQLVFNISSVDGATMDITAEYSAPDGACPGSTPVETKCILDACPAQFRANDGRCLAPKWLANGMPNPEPLYGCDLTRTSECACRQFWATDSLARAWLQYINGNGNVAAKCQAYGWALDEKRLIPGSTVCNSSTLLDNPVQPLRTVDTVPNGTLKIRITKII